MRVLDVGCGTGHWLTVMRELGAEPAGLDASSGMLGKAREREPNVVLKHGKAEHLPWPDASFGLVLANNALHHFSDPVAFIAEARRVLTVGGRLLVIGLDPALVRRWAVYEYFEGTHASDFARYPSSSQLRTWLVSAGFEHCNSRPVERFAERHSASDALARNLLSRESTSQLTLLSVEDHQRGIERIREAIAAAARGEELWLESDFCLYATTGVRGSI
jgi:ubiquinone/menaquinone biosynthesis C-methylase UbiE